MSRGFKEQSGVATPYGPARFSTMCFKALLALVSCGAFSFTYLCAQQTQLSASKVVEPAAASSQVTLEDAITRAKANEPAFAAAVASSKVAALDHSLARAALMPSVVYHN